MIVPRRDLLKMCDADAAATKLGCARQPARGSGHLAKDRLCQPVARAGCLCSLWKTIEDTNPEARSDLLPGRLPPARLSRLLGYQPVCTGRVD